MDEVKEYSNGEITIVWKPEVCIHSVRCAKGLPLVFNPDNRPWVNAKAATSQEIMDQIDQCPSGALSYYKNNVEEATSEQEVRHEQIVEIMANGPLMVYGNLTVKSDSGEELRDSKVTAFCRCGASSNKPYCDGSHKKIGFEG